MPRTTRASSAKSAKAQATNQKKGRKTKAKSPTPHEDLSAESLQRITVVKLKELCRNRFGEEHLKGLRTKAVIIQKILDLDAATAPDPTPQSPEMGSPLPESRKRKQPDTLSDASDSADSPPRLAKRAKKDATDPPTAQAATPEPQEIIRAATASPPVQSTAAPAAGDLSRQLSDLASLPGISTAALQVENAPVDANPSGDNWVSPPYSPASPVYIPKPLPETRSASPVFVPPTPTRPLPLPITPPPGPSSRRLTNPMLGDPWPMSRFRMPSSPTGFPSRYDPFEEKVSPTPIPKPKERTPIVNALGLSVGAGLSPTGKSIGVESASPCPAPASQEYAVEGEYEGREYEEGGEYEEGEEYEEGGERVEKEEGGENNKGRENDEGGEDVAGGENQEDGDDEGLLSPNSFMRRLDEEIAANDVLLAQAAATMFTMRGMAEDALMDLEAARTPVNASAEAIAAMKSRNRFLLDGTTSLVPYQREQLESERPELWNPPRMPTRFAPRR